MKRIVCLEWLFLLLYAAGDGVIQTFRRFGKERVTYKVCGKEIYPVIQTNATNSWTEQ